MMNLREIAAIALDEAGFAETLAEHDRRFHPNGYSDGQTCKFRDELSRKDGCDRVDSRIGASVSVCDITKEDSDAIVNAANRWMLGGGGVDGAIHRAAGPSLLEECNAFTPDENGYRVQTGDAKVTGAGNLKAKYVIHTAGPDIRDKECESDPDNGGALLRSSYRRSLEEAKRVGAKSVSFPSISTGIFGYPLEKAAQYAAEEITDFLAENPDMSVKMCIYDPFDSEKIAKAYEDAFRNAAEKHKQKGEAEDESPEVRNLRHLLRTNAISKKEFSSSLAALAAIGKVSKARIGLLKRQMFAEDAEPMTNLEKHDAKYHGGHYDGKSSCKYREEIAKGDKVDDLDPENVEGENVEGARTPTVEASQSVRAAKSLAQAISDAKADIDTILQGGVPSWYTGPTDTIEIMQNALDEYERAYESAGGGKAVSALKGILGKLKSQNGAVAKICQNRISQAQSAAASTNLPPGTMTPDEARNYAALEIAKRLGAKLTAPATQPQVAKATPVAQVTPKPTSAPQQPPAPQQTANAQTNQPTKFGPRPSLDISAAGFPTAAQFQFSTYGNAAAGWHGGTSGSTDPHSITIGGQKYWVKKAGNNANYTNAAAENEVNANKFIRLAGFNAPESKLYTENGINYCVTKDMPFSGTMSAKKDAAAMREAYPLMALIYSTDAAMNSNTKTDANGLVFLDNGSSFGFSAQGNRPNPNIDWDYDSRTEPDSTKNNASGIMALHDYPSQHEWRNAFGGGSQDDVLKEAAKYNMGDLVREAENKGILSHIPQKGRVSLETFANNLDALSAKYRTASTPQPSVSSPQTKAPQIQTPSQQPAAPAQTPQTQTNAQQGFNPQSPLHSSLLQQAHQSWKIPNYGGTKTPSTQLRNAQGVIAALSAAFQGNPSNVLSHATTANIANILTNGTFLANAHGMGGTVSGVNIPRKGIQAFQKQVNTILNPQGYKLQVHNNGGITISATNRAIANQALSSLGITPQQAKPTAQTNPQQSAQAAGGSKSWQNHLAALSAGKGNNQQLINAYNGISNWLNKAGV